MKKLILSVFAFAAVVFSANAQGTSKANVDADATIVETLAFTSLSEKLAFGSISTGTLGGTCVITPNATTGTRTATSDVDLLGATFGTANFTISGANNDYTISFPQSTVTLTGPNSKTMTVGNFQAYVVSKSAISTTGTIASGIDAFKVGATLTVGDNTANPGGLYAGTFSVLIAYN